MKQFPQFFTEDMRQELSKPVYSGSDKMRRANQAALKRLERHFNGDGTRTNRRGK